jgi:HAD superfamily hydrolase (TIGR01509 family)
VDRLIIFDFDGVVADSEILANTVLAEVMTELGAPTTTDESLDTFMGKRFADVIAMMEQRIGRPAPAAMPEDFQRRTLDRFRADLKEIPGFRRYVDSFPDLKRCVASSSSPDRLALCVDVLRLHDVFGSHVYSASHVARGKPHPDIFLHAAERCGVAPENCVVLEDSAHGVRGGIAAGMTVIGLIAGSHIRGGHAAQLREAGAQAIAKTYDEATTLTRAWIAGEPLSG